MGVIVLLIFGCVLHGFDRVVGNWLCVAWVVCCTGLVMSLISDCVLHGFYCVVDIWLCVA